MSVPSIRLAGRPVTVSSMVAVAVARAASVTLYVRVVDGGGARSEPRPRVVVDEVGPAPFCDRVQRARARTRGYSGEANGAAVGGRGDGLEAR
jgi:hypothetical protein